MKRFTCYAIIPVGPFRFKRPLYKGKDFPSAFRWCERQSWKVTLNGKRYDLDFKE